MCAGESYEADIALSIYDYWNVTEAGLVSNKLYTFQSERRCLESLFDDYTHSELQLLASDILVQNQGIFLGPTRRDKVDEVTGSTVYSKLQNLYDNYWTKVCGHYVSIVEKSCRIFLMSMSLSMCPDQLQLILKYI